MTERSEHNETDLENLWLAVVQSREGVAEAEKRLQYAKTAYAEAWNAYQTGAQAAGKVTKVEAKVKSYSHLLEGSMVMERKARFSDLSGEEIAPGTGAKLVLTQGDSRWEADIADSEVSEFLDRLNNPEEKKKRGRPAGDAAKPAAAETAGAKSS